MSKQYNKSVNMIYFTQFVCYDITQRLANNKLDIIY